MKKIKYQKLIFLLFSLCLILPIFSFSANSEELTAELTVLNDPTNLAIVVSYTDNGSGEEPTISFLSPSGEVFSESETEESKMSVVHTDQAIYYQISDAEAGSWQIVYDSSFQGHLTVQIATYAREIWIDYFEIESLHSSYARVRFWADFDSNSSYTYSISAVTRDTDGNIEGTKQLLEGNAYTNREVTVNVPLNNLVSYDQYYLQLEVYLTDYGVESSDTALSDVFSYENSNTPTIDGTMSLILNRSTEELTIDWSEAAIRKVDYYIVAVYLGEDTSVEPYFSSTYDQTITNCSLLMDSTLSAITVVLSYSYNGYTSSPLTQTLQNDSSYELTMTSEETTASSQAEFSYQFPSNCTWTIQLNEEEAFSQEFCTSGTFGLNIPEGQSEIYFVLAISDQTFLCYTFEIYSDRTAPYLSFYENLYSVTTSSDSFTVAGATEAGATLTVNGEDFTAEVQENGGFLLNLSLVSGENIFEIVSSDAVGNLSKRTVVITRSVSAAAISEGKSSDSLFIQFLPLILEAAALLLVALLILLLFRKSKKATVLQIIKRICLTSWILTIMGLLGTIVLLILKNQSASSVDSPDFFEIVKQSVQEAYRQLTRWNQFSTWLEIVLKCTLLLAGLSLLLTLLWILLVLLSKRNSPTFPPKKEKRARETEPSKAAVDPQASSDMPPISKEEKQETKRQNQESLPPKDEPLEPKESLKPDSTISQEKKDASATNKILNESVLEKSEESKQSASQETIPTTPQPKKAVAIATVRKAKHKDVSGKLLTHLSEEEKSEKEGFVQPNLAEQEEPNGQEPSIEMVENSKDSLDLPSTPAEPLKLEKSDEDNSFKRCPRCQNPVKADAKFCNRCGNKLS